MSGESPRPSFNSVKNRPPVRLRIAAPTTTWPPVVVDVLFEDPGDLALEHRTPETSYRLAAIEVVEEPAEPDLRERFETLRVNDDMSALREWVAPFIEAPADKTLSFVAEMDEIGPEGGVEISPSG